MEGLQRTIKVLSHIEDVRRSRKFLDLGGAWALRDRDG